MPPSFLPVWELSPRSPSPSHPSLTCLGLPGRLKALTPHVRLSPPLTSTITVPPPLGAAPGTTILQTSPPRSSGTACARDKETQLRHDVCCLVFSFNISCFPFFGVFESSVRPCSLPCEQEGGGGYQLIRHEICSHQPQPLASSLSMQATLTLVPLLCSHKLSHALAKLPCYKFGPRSCLHTSLGQARSTYLAFPLLP